MAPLTDVERARRDGVLLGIPLGDLGWFQSLLMGAATGMAAFFLSTFAAIVCMLIYMSATHRSVDFAKSYRDFGFPIGVAAMALALSYLGVQWARRMARKRAR